MTDVTTQEHTSIATQLADLESGWYSVPHLKFLLGVDSQPRRIELNSLLGRLAERRIIKSVDVHNGSEHSLRCWHLDVPAIRRYRADVADLERRTSRTVDDWQYAHTRRDGRPRTAHETRAEAMTEADRLTPSDPDRPSPMIYCCPECSRWHVSTFVPEKFTELHGAFEATS